MIAGAIEQVFAVTALVIVVMALAFVVMTLVIVVMALAFVVMALAFVVMALVNAAIEELLSVSDLQIHFAKEPLGLIVHSAIRKVTHVRMYQTSVSPF